MTNHTPVHKALLRWSLFVGLVVAFVVPAVVVDLRIREAESKAAECVVVMRSLAKQLASASDESGRRLLKAEFDRHMTMWRRYKRASHWPW